MTPTKHTENLRQIVRLVAILNFAYFGIEFAVARSTGSVSLFADSIDLGEDASVNYLILVALVSATPGTGWYDVSSHPADSGYRNAVDGLEKNLPIHYLRQHCRCH